MSRNRLGVYGLGWFRVWGLGFKGLGFRIRRLIFAIFAEEQGSADAAVEAGFRATPVP